MKTIHPAVAQHAMEENERLRGLLDRVVREVGRTITSELRADIDAALSQQAEPHPAQDEREAFRRALHGQRVFKLNSDTINAAEWAWFARPAQTEQQPIRVPERREPSRDNPYLSDEDHEWNAALDAAVALFAAPQPGQGGWVSVEDQRPECPHECTTDETLVSHSVLVTDIRDQGTLGLGHMRLDGTWKLYGGDYDFMHPEQITHWMPLPAAPALSPQGDKS